MSELLEGARLVLIYSLPVILSSLLAYGLSIILKEVLGWDILSAANYFLVLVIGSIPLLVTLVNPDIFTSEVYQKYITFSTNHLVEMISAEVGVMFHPLWKKIIKI